MIIISSFCCVCRSRRNWSTTEGRLLLNRIVESWHHKNDLWQADHTSQNKFARGMGLQGGQFSKLLKMRREKGSALWPNKESIPAETAYLPDPHKRGPRTTLPHHVMVHICENIKLHDDHNEGLDRQSCISRVQAAGSTKQKPMAWKTATNIWDKTVHPLTLLGKDSVC